MTTTTDSQFSSIAVGDARLYGDTRLIAEVERLRKEVTSQRGIVAALSDAAAKAPPAAPANPPTDQPVTDASQPIARDHLGRPLLNDAQMAALGDQCIQARRADYARKTDPSTVYGQYLDRITNGYRGKSSNAGV